MRRWSVLEWYRRNLGLLQSEVAEKTGIPQKRLSEIERGLRPHPEQLRALAAFFGVPETLSYVLLEEMPPTHVPAPDLAARIREMRGKA